MVGYERTRPWKAQGEMAGVSAGVSPAVDQPVVAHLAASLGAHRVLVPDAGRKGARVHVRPASRERRALASPVASPVASPGVRVLVVGPALLVQAVGLIAVRELLVPSGRRGR